LQVSVLYQKYLRTSFKIATATGFIISIFVLTGCYLGIDWLRFTFLKDVPWAVENLKIAADHFYVWVVPGLAGAILLFCWIIWAVLRLPVKKMFILVQAEVDALSKKGHTRKGFIDHKIEHDRKQRIFLHVLSVLQRDGRLLDFFDEDLEAYDDEQIGAAVRSIHEDCRKVIKKYIDPKPVIKEEEGEKLIIDRGFDMNSINLTGNVSGEPPFEGLVRHRGWKAGKNEIPKLADIQDASIITPAQVEIQ